MSAPAAEELRALLCGYADPDQATRLLDVPPAVADRALQHLPADLAAARLNRVQPPMTWLVEQASHLGARLVGSLTPGRGLVVFDGIQVEVASARTLAERIAGAWPATGDAPGALEAAVAEAWPSWAAPEPTWTGAGPALLVGPWPAGTVAVGLWWD
ncbi:MULTISPECIES: hypothetical protein [unclassified Modestobacter]